MITYLSCGAERTGAERTRKKLKDLNQQVGEHVYAFAQVVCSNIYL
jgi:hypothetical protein